MRAKRACGINAALWHPDIWDARVFFRLKRGFAFFLLGEMVEAGDTDDIFTSPSDPRTADYVAGRFG